MTDNDFKNQMPRMVGNFQFNGSVMINNGDGITVNVGGSPKVKPGTAEQERHAEPPSRTDLDFVSGDTYDDALDNAHELGTRLAHAMRHLGKSSKRSAEIGAVLLEAFRDSLIRYAPKAGPFKRLFDSYMGDAAISERGYAEVIEFLRRKRVPLDDI